MRNIVKLRKPVRSDKDIIFNWISCPELRKMTGTSNKPTKESHEIWFSKKLTDQENIFLIITLDSVPVGIVGTNAIDDSFNADIYIYLGKSEFWGKKIGTQALAMFIELLFDEFDLHKLTARIFSYNEPSLGLFRKSGFSCEGIQKEQILFEGKYYDLYLFGLINSKTLKRTK